MDRAISVLLMLLAGLFAFGGVALLLASPLGGMGGGNGQAIMAGTGLGAVAVSAGLVAIAIGVWRGSKLAWSLAMGVALLMVLGSLVLVFGSVLLLGVVLGVVGAAVLAAGTWRWGRGWT